MPFLFPTKIRHSSVQSLLSVFFFGVKFQEVRGDHAFYAELWHYSISSIHFVRNMKTDSNSKKPKKGSICEEDIATLLRRYPATAVLSLLQEVAILPESKIDWNALVKKTNTGISDAKECQMLWRHLAYSDALLDRPEDGAELLDDDSDLEFELEAYPTVNSDVAADIAACVKVLITSDLPSSAIIGHNLTVESLLTINATNGQSSRSASENKQTFTVPVSVDKHQSFVASAEGLEETGNMPPRKKRKAWSKAEDLELEAAVEKFGEGNWANIVKVNFKGDRTASQLSQRWAIIRKRKNLTVEITKSSGSQLSETQVIAARHAMSLALDMPSRKPGIGSKLSQNQSHQATVPGKPSPSEPTSTQNTIGLIKRSPPNASLDTDLGIKAAAVAAGARIATVKDAASLLIASQAKKAVHIIPSGRSQIKCSVPGPSSLRPGTFHLSSGSSSQAASTSSSTVKIAPPAKADTAAASDARVREQTTTDLPLEQEPIVKVVEAKAAYEPSNAPQSREHGASASAESTSETIQKESEMIDGKSNIEGDATNSGQKYCLSH